MKRLTWVVGHRGSVLVAAPLLILACGGESAAPVRPDAAVDSGQVATTLSLDGASDDLVIVAPPFAADAASLVADARVDGPRPARDAAEPRDSAEPRDGAGDAAVLTGGGPPAPWQAVDIGTVGRRGDTTATPTSFTVVAGGRDIGGAADSFHFVYQAWSGDGEIVARVSALTSVTDPADKAGVMLRAGLEAADANVLLALLGDGSGGRLQARDAAGGATKVALSDPALKVGQFLRLTRVGNSVRAFRSSNRATWTPVGSIELELPQTIYVGLATEAHSDSDALQAVYNYLTVDNLATDPLTSSWEHLDVGTLGGVALARNGALILTGFGEPFTPAQDYFTGVVREVSGSQRLVARVSLATSGNAQARVGLMFREGLAASASRSSAFVMLALAPGGGVQLTSRAEQGGMTVAGARNNDVKGQTWLRLDKLELGARNQFTGAYSADGITWTTLDSVTLSVAEPLLAGVVEGAGSARVMSLAHIDELSLIPVAGDGAAPDAGGSTVDAGQSGADGGAADAAAGG
jgi:hypothetical protein